MTHVVRVDLLEGGVISTSLSDGTEFPCLKTGLNPVDEFVKDVNDILEDHGNVFSCFTEDDVKLEFVENLYLRKHSLN